MKQKLIVFSTGLTILSAVAFMGCSQEDGLLTDDDLSINSQVPKRRAPSEQIDINPDPDKLQEIGENECALVALVDAKREIDGRFGEGKNLGTAQEFYNDLKQSAKDMKKEDGTSWNYQGGFMDLDLFTQLGQSYGILSERKNLSSNTERDEIFSDEKNSPRIILIEIYDKKSKKYVPHVANIISINKKKRTISYSGHFKSISFDEVKAVWM